MKVILSKHFCDADGQRHTIRTEYEGNKAEIARNIGTLIAMMQSFPKTQPLAESELSLEHSKPIITLN